MIDRLTLSAFAAALFLSAGLLFNIQPMVGKMLLPLVGGAPAVWNVAMAFFQISLLLGYFVAYALSRTPPLVHALGYLAALAGATCFLPIALPAGWQPPPDSYPPFQVLGILVMGVAAPFVALSLSAPTLQRLFATTRHEQASDPYFLYVASNLGSFAGLLLYPLVLEAHFDVAGQAALWRGGYVVLLGLATLCLALQVWQPARQPRTGTPAAASASPGWSRRAGWLVLALIPSSLTLGVTSYITTDVSPTPLLWVLTLGLYLLTFIIAFARRGERARTFNLARYHWIGCLAVACYLVPFPLPWPVVIVNLAAFFMTALTCHTLLARSRPGPDRLTEFYFWLALGGALGGSFNAFLAPVLFSQLLEYPLMLILGLMAFVPGCQEGGRRRQIMMGLTATALTLVTATFYLSEAAASHETLRRLLMIALLACAFLFLRARRWVFGLAGICAILGLSLSDLYGNRLFGGRDFFGIINVRQSYDEIAGITIRTLEHGNTTHGVQIVGPEVSTIPTAYYSPTSPIADMFHRLQPSAVAAIGLGSGAINCFAKPGQSFHFIEIDPLMVRVAREFFTFLSACPEPRITIGDGRLEMARDPDRYDMIIVDAFSSDMIPVHLLTREALAMYRDRLRPGGVIAIHISSRFFRLEPMIAAVAGQLGLSGLRGLSAVSRTEKNVIHMPSEWVVLAPAPLPLAKLLVPATDPPQQELPFWEEIRTRPDVPAWTDGYSNLLSVLKWSPNLDPPRSLSAMVAPPPVEPP